MSITITLSEQNESNNKIKKEEEKEKEKEKIPVYLKKLEDNLDHFAKIIELQQQSLNELNKNFQWIDKTARKLIDKQKVQYQKSKTPRKCGFAKEVRVSEDLCQFMGLEKGSLIPRTQVTKYLMNYIKTNQLVNPANKKQVVPDEALWRILGDDARQSPAGTLTHFTLQKYMNKHFLGLGG